MIIWSGWGFLPVLFGGLGMVAGVLLDPLLARLGLPAQSGLIVGWLAAAAVNGWVGTRLNGGQGRELIDPTTGQRVILRRRHTLFWIPMQYYSVLMLLLGILAVLGALGVGSASRLRPQ
ncbi:hypothetical protein [Methylobacterium sp. A54F]